ncbi:MAG: helix-turn-helix domain-containing protein [Rhodomicrobium sp.]
MDTLFAIGALSRETGVKVPTIRYYEQAGLLPPPPRTASQRRVYDDGAVKRLRFIRHARELGFEIEDIRTLLAMTAEPQASCDQADSIARRHLGQVERRITQLSALREELQRMIAECDRGRVCDCRVIEVLADHGQCQHEHG